MLIDDLPVEERRVLEQPEDDADLERRLAEVKAQMELLEARVRAARLAGA